MSLPEEQPLPRLVLVEEIEVQCPECGLMWYAEAHTEHGVYVLENEDEGRCERCDDE